MAAAAQNINNSTLWLILQSEKLTSRNITNWNRNLRIALRYENKLVHLEQPLITIPLHATSQATRDAYEALFDVQNEVACLMLELKTMFEEQAKQELFETVKAFHAYKQKDGQSDPEGQEKTIREKGKDKGKNKLAYAPSPRSHRRLRERIQKRTRSATTARRKSRKLKHGVVSLCVRNGMYASVEAIMACKPFPHQVKRAKDLLGLIHNDVCVPFRMVSKKASGSHGLLKVSVSDVGLELIQEDDIQPFKNTSKRHDEAEPTKVDPHYVEVPIRRSRRISQAHDRYSFYVDVEHELGDLNEPPNYKAVLLDLEPDKWLDAMNTEMHSIKDNQVWCLVDLHPNGEATYILEIKITRDRSKWLIALSHSAYFDKILKKFKMDNTKRGSVPMPKKLDYRKSQGEVQWTAVKTILKYLRNTKDMVLVYGGRPEIELKKSAKQSTIDVSSTEAEYIATTEASIEVVWMGKFIDGLGDVMSSNKRPMEMLYDNTPAIEIANDHEIMKGSKHYQRKYHYIREVIQAGEIILKKVHTNDNLADPFTKPMPYNKHFKHAIGINVFPAISLI
nr:hypothetical protein [Tanacetum cinerariifolium]